MELSMWILADALAECRCRLDISRGLPEIQGVRFLAQTDFLSPDMAYVGVQNEFIDGRATPGILCAHQRDSILAEAESEQDVFNRLLNRFDLYRGWDRRMRAALEQGTTLQELLELSEPVLRSRAWIVERGGRICAALGSDCRDRELFYAGENGPFMRSDCLRLLRPQDENKDRDTYMVPALGLCCRYLYDGPNRVGMLFVESGAMLDRALEQTAGFLGGYLESWLEQNPDRTDLPPGCTMLLQLLRPQPEAACVGDFEAHLEGLGWDIRDRKMLYLIRTASGLPPARPAQYLRNCFPEALVTVFGSSVVLLADLPVSGETRLTGELKDMMKKMPCAVGASYPFRGLEELYQAYEQAHLALESGARTGQICPASTCMPAYVCSLIRSQTTAELAHPAIAVLERYDASHGTQLLETLWIYLLYERNLKQSASVLSLHRNTMAYRLNKIYTLCGLDLENPETRIQLLLSFLLRGGGRLTAAARRIDRVDAAVQ